MFAFTGKSLILENWPIVLTVLIASIIWIRQRQKSLQTVTPSKPPVADLDGAEDIGDPSNIEDISDDQLPQPTQLQSHLADRPHIPYAGATHHLGPDGANLIHRILNDRRSVRKFDATRPVSADALRSCIRAAGCAPSGAHTEPWTFCVIRSAAIKRQVRDIVEAEELLNYTKRMAAQWRADLQPLRTDHRKAYLEEAPALVLIFKQTYGLRRADGQKQQHYYHEISVAIAVGLLLAALQCAGLSSLVTTPLNCGPALRELLGRPANEKLMVLLPVGYAAQDCRVPDIGRKAVEEIMVEY